MVQSYLSSGILSGLPEDDADRFLTIVQYARDRRDSELAHASAEDAVDIRSQYMIDIFAAADVLGVKGLPNPLESTSEYENFRRFDNSVSFHIARMKIGNHVASKSMSVRIPAHTKATLQEELERLRENINASNLSAERKSALHTRIDAVEKELAKERSRLAPFGALVGLLMLLGGAPGVVGIAADSKPAIENVSTATEGLRAIISGVVESRVAEEPTVSEAVKALPPPRKAITHETAPKGEE